MFNRANYNDLFNEKEKTITWHSDETAYEVANILIIRKLADTFRIEFYVQPHIDGYDEDFNSHGRIPIRFRNSASLYEPFNIVFMRMFDQLQTVDDVKDTYHQIHFDEYLYEMDKSLTLSKKIDIITLLR